MSLRTAILALTASLAVPAFAEAQVARLRATPTPAAPVTSEQLTLSGQGRLSPVARAFVASQGALIAAGGDGSEPAVRGAISRANLGSMTAADIDSLVVLVMMQAAQDTQDDLRREMDAVKAANAQKQALRGKVQPGAPARPLIMTTPPVAYTLDRPGRQPLQAQVDQMKQDMDSLGDMSETAQTRIQMLMDRRSKLLETLSNIMKKVSDTQSTITKNMK